MIAHQIRRDTERLSCKQVCSYELTRVLGGNRVQLREGAGYSINRSIGGMLLLLSEKVDRQQVFEIQETPEMKSEEFSKLGEVRWTRPIPVESYGHMYLVGIRFLLNLPAANQSSQLL